MLQIRGGLDLAQEALGADYRRELGAQDLDGDIAVVLEVVREVDRGHAAAAEFLQDSILAERTEFSRLLRGAERGHVRCGIEFLDEVLRFVGVHLEQFDSRC